MRLIDADEIKFIRARKSGGDGLFVKWLKEILKHAPTVDAVPVVRCNDCSRDGTIDCPMCCCYFADGKIYETRSWNSPVDFCSRGERKGT